MALRGSSSAENAVKIAADKRMQAKAAKRDFIDLG
jgi:hypothetical protein